MDRVGHRDESSCWSDDFGRHSDVTVGGLVRRVLDDVGRLMPMARGVVTSGRSDESSCLSDGLAHGLVLAMALELEQVVGPRRALGFSLCR